jgi:hypothetical protein
MHFYNGVVAMSSATYSSEQSYGTRSPMTPDHSEGPVASMIENQTARLPSDLFLWAACGSIVASLVMKSSGRDHMALFVGQWAPTFLLLGLYNKIVKVAGSDQG